MTTKKSKRTGLTEQTVFQKTKYTNLLMWIMYTTAFRQPLRQGDLIQKFVESGNTVKGKKYKPSKEVDAAILLLIEKSIIKPDEKFKSKYGLRRALARLRKLKLIGAYKPKKGYRCIVGTEKGMHLILQWQIKKLLDFIEDNNILFEIQNYIIEKNIEDLDRILKKGGEE